MLLEVLLAILVLLAALIVVFGVLAWRLERTRQTLERIFREKRDG